MGANEGWRDGYIAGWQTVKRTIPSIPARPGSYPPGVSDVYSYFYNLGHQLGQANASR